MLTLEKIVVIKYIELSYTLEKTVASFYLKLSEAFKEDAEFWWRLCLEEQNHASIFKSFMDGLLPVSLLPEELLDPDLGKIRAAINMLEEKLNNLDASPMSKHDACEFAISVEETAGEFFLQKAADEASDSDGVLIIKKLLHDDKDHAARIRKFADTIAQVPVAV